MIQTNLPSRVHCSVYFVGTDPLQANVTTSYEIRVTETIYQEMKTSLVFPFFPIECIT